MNFRRTVIQQIMVIMLLSASVAFGAWNSTDLGSPNFPGSVSWDADSTLTIEASGIDIWNTKDEGHFVYKQWSSETLELTARFISVDSADIWSKGCVMIRESLADSARHYSVFTGFGNQVRFGKRAELGGSSSSMKPKDDLGNDISNAAYESKPVWLKIIREGSMFRGYFSTDGDMWKRIGVTDTLGIPTDVYIGIALTAHNPDALVTGVFDNITMSEDITIPDIPDWRNTDLGEPQFPGSMMWSEDGSQLTIEASGIDIWNNQDEGHFVYLPWSKKTLELTARFVSVDSADVWSKGCVMIRESLDDSARHYSVFSGYGNQVRFGKRAEFGGSSSSMKPKDDLGNDISNAAYESKPVWLKIIREDNVFRGYFSEDGEMWKRVGVTDTLGIPAKAFIGIALTSHNPDASVKGVFDNITMSEHITVPDLPDWRSTDLGEPAIPGSMMVGNDGTVTVEAGGIDIWNNQDEGHFVYIPWNKSTLELTARFVSIDSADVWSKGCVMIRESLDDSARHYSVFSGYGNQVRFGKRAEFGGASSSMKPKDEAGNDISNAAYESKPVWLKIIREGSQFRGYFSTDGTAWQVVGVMDELDIPTKSFIGLAATSHNPDALVSAVFENITISEEITIKVGVEQTSKNLPAFYELYNNYPNPFNPKTTIRFALPKDEHIKLSIYNIRGQEIAVLFEGKMEAGIHNMTFEGMNCATGLYFYKLEAGEHVFSKKMMLIR
ncbi:T9SS C-terminal target domain-containing protein [candidate division KSB1 bacterium]|nr:T9SS type A sorting domain-containing protein [candidate division KSB1 bacterium]RQW01344.1 MAG: T9SS C-terminal target domain-containing protein [candidate division KSB1 bacterium]